MKRTIARITALFIVAVMLAPGLSATAKGDTIQIEKPWARASIIKSRPAAAYMTIANQSGKVDRLVSVSSPMAGNVSIHLSEMVDGMMKMGPVHDLPLKPGEAVTLKPGGLHLMLMKLRAPLKKGDRLQLTLNFEVAGKIDVQAKILGPGASGPD